MMFDFQVPFSSGKSVLSVSELIDMYLHGIPVFRIREGGSLSEETIKFFIDSATKEIEGYLNLRVIEQQVVESKDFVLNDWKNWGYVKTSYPVKEILKLEGQLNGLVQIEYPSQWLSVQSASDDESFFKQIHIVPGRNTAQTGGVLVYGIIPHVGLLSYQFIPNYWKITYKTGYKNVPTDILNTIGMLAALNVFYILGDLVLGAPGLTSKSISIDGLSQNYSVGNEAFAGRIKNYLAELKESLPRLKNKYTGFEMISM